MWRMMMHNMVCITWLILAEKETFQWILELKKNNNIGINRLIQRREAWYYGPNSLYFLCELEGEPLPWVRGVLVELLPRGEWKHFGQVVGQGGQSGRLGSNGKMAVPCCDRRPQCWWSGHFSSGGGWWSDDLKLGILLGGWFRTRRKLMMSTTFWSKGWTVWSRLARKGNKRKWLIDWEDNGGKDEAKRTQ